MGRAKPHEYTEEQIKFLSDNIKGRPYKELWKLFNQHFGLNLTFTQIQGVIKRNSLTNEREGRFKKGCTPFNKGKKYPGQTNKTSFKKGMVPINHKPIGSERIDIDGYTLIKVAEPSTWKCKHVVLWEEVNGPIPENHCLIFLNGDKSNISLDNLKLITRSQLLRMNQNHLITSDPELTKTGVILADIFAKMGERKREIKYRS